MARTRIFAAFWSYTRLDDDHENQRITRLRKRLEDSIRFFSGKRVFASSKIVMILAGVKNGRERLPDHLITHSYCSPLLLPRTFEPRV
jgi:hypothetical protein